MVITLFLGLSLPQVAVVAVETCQIQRRVQEVLEVVREEMEVGQALLETHHQLPHLKETMVETQALLRQTMDQVEVVEHLRLVRTEPARPEVTAAMAFHLPLTSRQQREVEAEAEALLGEPLEQEALGAEAQGQRGQQTELPEQTILAVVEVVAATADQ
jgi:hypothetical protein